MSPVSVWEITIKKALGKLDVPAELPEVLGAEPFLHLDITIEHAFKVGDLPMRDRDPFDGMQAGESENGS